ARTQLGPIDEVVHLSGTAHLDETVRAVAGTSSIPGTDPGVLSLVRSGATAVATRGGSTRVEASANVNEVDFDAARRFGSDPSITGFASAGRTPSGNEAIVAKP